MNRAETGGFQGRSKDYLEAAEASFEAFLAALCSAFAAFLAGAEAGAEAASAAKAPVAMKEEAIRAARSLVIFRYLKELELLSRQGVAPVKRFTLSSG